MEQKILGSTVLSWQFYRTVLTDLNSILKKCQSFYFTEWTKLHSMLFYNRYHLWYRKHKPNLQPPAKQNITFPSLTEKAWQHASELQATQTLLPMAMYCRREQCRIALVWTATIKNELFLESNDDACCSLPAAFPCHLPKRRTLLFCNNTNILNAFRAFELKCPILQNAFLASLILVALLYAHYNVLFEVLRNCLSLGQNIERKYLNDMLQYSRSPADLFAWI